MNGFDVLKNLKEKEETKNIPVIVLTNLEGMDDIGKVLALGANTYLVKTEYEIEEIIQKIKKALKE
jgi:PleD family two-component response regulator